MTTSTIAEEQTNNYPMENYLQRAWSDASDNVNIDDVKDVIIELKTIDDEHGAFWVGVFDAEETVLETDKTMKVILGFNGNGDDSTKQLSDWNEVIQLYELLLNGNFEQLRQKMQ